METARLTNGEELVVDIIRGAEDPRVIGREPVFLSDLQLARDETWREGVRAGRLTPRDPRRYTMNILTGKRGSQRGVADYRIELIDQDTSFQQSFSIASLAPVASRQVAALVDQQVLADGDSYLFYLNTVPATPLSPPVEPAASVLHVTHRSDALVFEEADLGEFLANSDDISPAGAPAGTPVNQFLPVFISPSLWQESFQQARRGGARESAAVWTGRLMRDTRSPEMFIVIDACIEARHANEQEASVTFSGDTWGDIRSVLNQRRERLQRPHERIVGAVHGHNFPPSGVGKSCANCPAVDRCLLTSAVASAADSQWFAAVFAGQPWALFLIHGFDARGRDDWRLYHLSNASLATRTIRRLRS